MSRRSLAGIARGKPGDGRGNVLHGDRLEWRGPLGGRRSSGNAASERTMALPP